jgi:hypothetical protein
MLVDLMAPLDEALQLPPEFHAVQAYLHQHDPDLRLRCSVERPGMFVLERRCRRAPAVNTGMRTRSDMHVQARDGYIHVSIVHREWLMHPWNIIIALREEGADLWAATSADAVVDEIEYEERWQVETRRRRRRDEHKGYYREAYDVLSRIGNGDGTEVTRFTNPGLPAAADVCSPAAP